MDEDVDGRICTNEQCKFAETNLCVEGNDINECPYLQLLDATASEDDEADASPHPPDKQSAAEPVRLGGEEHLSVTEASTLFKARYVPLIAFLGEVGAGKTSLIAEVYDAFQYGSYASLAFAGSRTLMAFERICYKVRAASKAPEPEHDRTEIHGDPFFFHLALSTDNTEHPIDILLADRSGETYRAIADVPNIAARCLELNRATTLNILVDGARLCDPVQRTAALTECTQALQTLALSDVLAQDVPVNLVMTKLDIVDTQENNTRAHSEFDALGDRILAQCRGAIARVNPFKIAACPQTDAHPKGYGVEALIKSWIATEPAQGVYSNVVVNSDRAMSRAPSSLETS